MWTNSQLAFLFCQSIQRIQRKRCCNKCVGRNSKIPCVYTWWYVLQCILKAELCAWWNSHYRLKTLLKILSWNMLTIIAEQLFLECVLAITKGCNHRGLQWLWYTILLLQCFWRWNIIKFSFLNKEGKKNSAQVNDVKNVSRKGISKKNLIAWINIINWS